MVAHPFNFIFGVKLLDQLRHNGTMLSCAGDQQKSSKFFGHSVFMLKLNGIQVEYLTTLSQIEDAQVFIHALDQNTDPLFETYNNLLISFEGSFIHLGK